MDVRKDADDALPTHPSVTGEAEEAELEAAAREQAAEGAAELDAEIARRESGEVRGRPGSGLGAGLARPPPD